jgi:hypothetical protein
MPDSSRSFRRLCSGALRDGRIIRLEWDLRGRGAGPSDSRAPPPSFITGRSPLLRTVADARSFHILPSWLLTNKISEPQKLNGNNQLIWFTVLKLVCLTTVLKLVCLTTMLIYMQSLYLTKCNNKLFVAVYNQKNH